MQVRAISKWKGRYNVVFVASQVINNTWSETTRRKGKEFIQSPLFHILPEPSRKDISSQPMVRKSPKDLML